MNEERLARQVQRQGVVSCSGKKTHRGKEEHYLGGF